MPVGEEEFESIPWSHLVEQTGRQPWLVYVAAAAVVALVVGVTMARTSPGPVSEPPEVTGAVASTTTVAPVLLTEADLRRSGAGEAREDMAAMRAEWFVRDYFTIDAAADRTEQLAAALGWSIADDVPAVTTYVEWARSWEVQPVDVDRFRVLVAYRSLTAAGESFVRGSPRAVAVQVTVTNDGAVRVLDFPEPIELPEELAVSPPPEAKPLPEPVVDRVLDIASVWGDVIEVIEGSETSKGWRVVVVLTDDQATPWPMAIHVESGLLATGDG